MHLELVEAASLADVFKKANKRDPQSVGDLEDFLDSGKKSVSGGDSESDTGSKSNDKKSKSRSSSNTQSGGSDGLEEEIRKYIYEMEKLQVQLRAAMDEAEKKLKPKE